MPTRSLLPNTARGRALSVAAATVALLGVGVGLSSALRQSGPPTAAIGLPGSGSLPVAARFPAVTTSTSSRPRITVSSAAPIAPAVPTTNPSTTAGFLLGSTPAASGPVVTTATLPVPVLVPAPTSPPRILLVPAVTATLPPPPPPLDASALTWTGPATLTIAAGTTAPLSVTADNPNDRDVALAHPLSCTPRLDHSETCAQVVQLIAAHASATATYTIDAQGVAPGSYTLSIEGVLTVAVTVT